MLRNETIPKNRDHVGKWTLAFVSSATNDLTMTIKSALDDISDTEAIKYLQEYFSPEHPFYTGSHFESLEAYNNPEDRITASDLYAVATLNTPIRRKASMGILITEAEELNGHIAQITSKKLGSLSPDEFKKHLGPDSAALQLWNALRRKSKPTDEKWNVGPTRASKIMARKRPHLIPISDSVIHRVLDQTSSKYDWKLWWEALSTNGGLERRAEALRTEIKRPELSTLRVFDIVLWMSGTKGFHKK